MIYQVVYKDAKGNALLEATFNADGPRDALLILLTTPSAAPPSGTDSIEVHRVES